MTSMRAVIVIISSCFAFPNLFAGIDSGGGIAPVGDGANHSSIGAPIETGSASMGLIDILYPAAPTFDSEADSDGNGLPDAWELQHFGSTGVDPSGDADGDGTTNMMEYLAGTDPKSPSSVFRPTSHIEAGRMILSVPTVEGRQYRVWGTANLQTGWGSFPLDTIVGDGSTIEWEYLMSQSPNGRYFLRIEIMIPQQN
jgi:hypothetical protein